MSAFWFVHFVKWVCLICSESLMLWLLCFMNSFSLIFDHLQSNYFAPQLRQLKSLIVWITNLKTLKMWLYWWSNVECHNKAASDWWKFRNHRLSGAVIGQFYSDVTWFQPFWKLSENWMCGASCVKILLWVCWRAAARLQWYLVLNSAGFTPDYRDRIRSQKYFAGQWYARNSPVQIIVDYFVFFIQQQWQVDVMWRWNFSRCRFPPTTHVIFHFTFLGGVLRSLYARAETQLYLCRLAGFTCIFGS